MFDSQTLFILGAGASNEVGLPIGLGLTKKIADLINFSVERGGVSRGDERIYDALRTLGSEDQWANNAFIKSGREVAEAMDLAQSIDTFLESHSANREFVVLGKLGIARAIAMAERGSLLMPSVKGFSQLRINQVANTWYYSLARQLFTGVPADKPNRAFQNVSFIVFNYDRCLQTFLQRAAEVYFRIDAGTAAQLVSKIKIIHPYGSLGSIFEHEADFVSFGSDRFDLLKVSHGIKTFSESADMVPAIRQLVYGADRIVFLGFGFHPQNIDLLDVSGSVGHEDPRPRKVFATTMGMSQSDESLVTEQISYALLGMPSGSDYRQRIFTNSGSCSDLFSTYWRSLTA